MAEHETAPAAGGDHGHDGHDHGGLMKYVWVAIALLVLTTGSFMTYFPFWDAMFSDHVAWAFMMAISCTKAMLVILFFMHLKYEANWKYVLTVPAAMMSIFLLLMLVPDVGFRMRNYSEQRLEHMAIPEKEHDQGH